MNITIVAGARPNFMKVAPIIREIEKSSDIQYRLVHTGQHFDHNMSGAFFSDLKIPMPDANLSCGGGSQAEQAASIMTGFEAELTANRPDLVLVVGDVTSTMACAITAKKMHVKVVHVEAGIRSGDMEMPEEINRIVTDSISDYFFTTTELAKRTLIKEGHDEKHVHFVGNVMIDTLLHHIDEAITPSEITLPEEYLVLTLHRPSNVDDPTKLRAMLDVIMESSSHVGVVFPVHPRTRKTLDSIGYEHERLLLARPMRYLEFIHLIKNANGIITDSGGITEEATVLDIPCTTLRDTTERPETVSMGTNVLVGNDLRKIEVHVNSMAVGFWGKRGKVPNLWDGKSASRIVSIIRTFDLKPD